MLKEIFINLIETYTKNEKLTNKLWQEIEDNYSNKKRHYHNLSHLENLYYQLLEVKDKISNWDVLLFTLFYHDAIYNATKTNNEEQSAILAEKRMTQINAPTELIEKCKAQILATKNHNNSTDLDCNYFTDADLSILGQDQKIYETYFKNIRKEYSIYPSIIYNPGREKVLNHFLNMDRIFKTAYFYEKYEEQAKINLTFELELL